MNRFFRSALFPLIVIVLLVYLASQTLMRGGGKEVKTTLSALIQQVKTQPAEFKDFTFDPNKQKISYERQDGAKGSVSYPTPQAQIQFQNLLESRSVQFDSKGVGSSPWWSILTSLLPFVLLFGFWIFLMNQVQGGGSKVMSFGKSRA
ncbi:MAG: cell division protein FtsH, partial [Actinobacteria bacterium]|nr:cell division protein FtsH [Actinomycetota bacterium]